LGGPETGRVLTASSNAVYTGSGYLIFARGAALLAQRFDAGTLRSIAPPIVVNQRVGVYGEDGPPGLGAFSVSTDGALATTDALRPPLRFSWVDRHGRLIKTEETAMHPTTVAIDRAKNVFELAVADVHGQGGGLFVGLSAQPGFRPPGRPVEAQHPQVIPGGRHAFHGHQRAAIVRPGQRVLRERAPSAVPAGCSRRPAS